MKGYELFWCRRPHYRVCDIAARGGHLADVSTGRDPEWAYRWRAYISRVRCCIGRTIVVWVVLA
jgi:hypothetical protein